MIPALEPGTVVAVKDNQPHLAESIHEFFAAGWANHCANASHDYYETVEQGPLKRPALPALVANAIDFYFAH